MSSEGIKKRFPKQVRRSGCRGAPPKLLLLGWESYRLTCFRPSRRRLRRPGGKTCVAGLLNAKVNGETVLTCDGHPSQSGHKLITKTIVQLIPAK